MEKPMTSFDELEANLGSGEEIPPQNFEPFFLDRLEIAEQAYNAARSIDILASGHTLDDTWMAPWERLSDEEKAEYEDIVLLALKMQKEPEENFARIVHGKRAMQYLLKEYHFSEKHSDDFKVTHLVAPWESIPNEKKAPLLAFKGVVKSLFSVWDHDNPHIKALRKR